MPCLVVFFAPTKHHYSGRVRVFGNFCNLFDLAVVTVMRERWEVGEGKMAPNSGAGIG